MGLNSSGVGVTLNAIKARGVDFGKLPCHLALRTVMECHSRAEATEVLHRAGVASACHVTVADAATGGIGLECSSTDIFEMPMSDVGICTHTNHFVGLHEGVDPKVLLSDSAFRLDRIRELLAERVGHRIPPSRQSILEMLKDEKGSPGAICRSTSEKHPTETLFSIVTDLKKMEGWVKLGKPIEGGEELVIKP